MDLLFICKIQLCGLALTVHMTQHSWC